MRLIEHGVNFLLYEKRCDIISMERGLLDGYGRPDILGVTRDRKLLEIEIKESFSDFQANFSKGIIKLYRERPEYAPHYFYFLVNPGIALQVEQYCSDKHAGYGIITIKNGTWSVIRKAVQNKQAKKLSIPKMITMVRNQSKSFVEEWKRINTTEGKIVVSPVAPF